MGLQSSKNSNSIYYSKEKSRKLKNIFSSPPGLTKVLQVEFRQLNDKLDIINKNVLYITYKIDKVSLYQKTLDSDLEHGSSDNNPESD